MQRSLFKWCLFFSWVARIGGSQKIWKPDDSLVNQRIMKSILESCYEGESLSTPIVIIGDFSELIDKSSVIKLNELYNFDEEAQYSTLPGKVSHVASKIILIEDSPKKLESDLELLQATRWWDNMALFFIIEKNAKTCDNFKDMLLTTWKMDILNSIYICSESNNEAALYTFNPIANYAPSPWKRREVRPEHLAMFHQIFDSHIACENLHYDKTKILDGYEITVIVDEDFAPEIPRIDFREFNKYLRFSKEYVLLWGLFTSWDVTARIKRVGSLIDLLDHFEKRTADMSLRSFSSTRTAKRLIPTYYWLEVIALGEWHQEQSTLTKICQLWSSSVSIAAAITLGILLIILTIQNHNFVTAVLNLIRLLTYTSISANNRSHKFRIYFTTMLIFIVIINGVFQGFIVTFLIKPKRVSPPPAFDELGELGYKMYAHPSHVDLLRELYPKYNIEGTTIINCIMSARNKPHHACLLAQYAYWEVADAHNLDVIKEPMDSEHRFYANRENWPLRNCFMKRFLRIFESGVLNVWMTAGTEKARLAYQARKSERSSLQYKPLKLNDLTFAFQLLGFGMSISTIVFFIELIVGKWSECRKMKLKTLRLNQLCDKTG